MKRRCVRVRPVVGCSIVALAMGAAAPGWSACWSPTVLAALQDGARRGDHQFAPSSSFTYQGMVWWEGLPVTEVLDFRFVLFDAESGGFSTSDVIEACDVAMFDGRFAARLDFGWEAFAGGPRWLEIQVRRSGSDDPFIALTPRQAMRLTPFAMFALDVRVNVTGEGATEGHGLHAGDSTDAFAPGDGHRSVQPTGSDASRGFGFIGGVGPGGPGSPVGPGGRGSGDLARPGHPVIPGGGDGLGAVRPTSPGEPDGGGSWLLTGNAGTNPGMNFLGTTDNQAFEIRVNNRRALRIEPKNAGPNVILGVDGNSVGGAVVGATIAGGGSTQLPNTVTGNSGTIGGGRGNVAGLIATVAGGLNNQATADRSTVSGGTANVASGAFSAIGGGRMNTASGTDARVGGGRSNRAIELNATVGGGSENFADAQSSTISGGEDNWVTAWAATISGGNGNLAEGELSTIGGGNTNRASGEDSTISGGEFNQAVANAAAVGGGRSNSALGDLSTIGGGELNRATGQHSFVGGGQENVAAQNHAAVVGGRSNGAAAPLSFVGGGRSNVANAAESAIVSGFGNFILGDGNGAVIGGGLTNNISGGQAFIGGGASNNVTGIAGAIAGGSLNIVSGKFAFVPAGFSNRAGGMSSFAGGHRAAVEAGHDGTFIWSARPATEGTDFASTGAGQFLISAPGGVGIGTNAPQADLHILGPAGLGTLLITPTNANSNAEIFLAEQQAKSFGVILRYHGGLNQFQFISQSNFVESSPLLTIVRSNTPRVGVGRTAAANALEVQGNASKTTAGDWLANSDRRIKTDIESISDALSTLDRVRLTSFRYTPEYRSAHPEIEDRRYLNVIAQEFATVFPEHVKSSGESLPDGSEILQVDAYPLTIYSAAAIQELHAMVREQARRLLAGETSLTEVRREQVLAAESIRTLRSEVESLRARNAELESRLSRLEAMMSTLPREE